ncbi:hypothetical protein [uncultured Aquimarina sp.]|nr:hypothetical protein [uncultured Aquimarina sp.]
MTPFDTTTFLAEPIVVINITDSNLRTCNMIKLLNSYMIAYIFFLNTEIVTSAVVILSIIIITFFIRKNVYDRSKINRITKEKNRLIERLTIKEEQIKSLMADNSMRLTFKEEWLAKLKNDVMVTADAKELRESLNSLIAQLRLQIDTENKLAGLQEKIDYHNISFDTTLKKMYPDLTKGEREVCALLRLNLSIKEIMIIRNVTADSVKSMRRRIRKKMNLSQEIELESFIQQLV